MSPSHLTPEEGTEMASGGIAEPKVQLSVLLKVIKRLETHDKKLSTQIDRLRKQIEEHHKEVDRSQRERDHLSKEVKKLQKINKNLNIEVSGIYKKKISWQISIAIVAALLNIIINILSDQIEKYFIWFPTIFVILIMVGMAGFLIMVQIKVHG